MNNLFRILFLSSFVLSAHLKVEAKGKQPNIVFIMADDLGVGWVDYFGTNEKLKTPNLERLAKSGMIFNKAYAAAPVCSPTRASCITGQTPAKVGLTTHAPGIGLESYLKRSGGLGKGGAVDAETAAFLPKDAPSYARELKKLGYSTAFFGKWHLAGEGSLKTSDGIINKEWHPENYGFDINMGGCAYGQPRSYFDPYRNGTIENRKQGEYLTERLGDEAADHIRKHHKELFHVTLWLYSVHTPFKAPKSLVQQNGGDTFLAMVESMDRAVGKVIDALEETGTLDNTLFVFYSDNGGHKPTEGLAEKKGSLLEGGIRVPMVVSWPGKIKAGTTTDEPVSSIDLLPTFVNAAGGDASKMKEIEGKDLAPLFEGKKKLGREALYFHFPHNRHGLKYIMGSVIIEGEWKLYKGYGETKTALFNLKKDPQEKSNIIEENKSIADRLDKKLNAWLTKVDAKMPRKDADFQ